ncbi:MAG: SulP family inorganic anion transporter [Pirellulaceae bacterium]
MANDKMMPGKVNTFKQDFLASIVVFLVALPLCMGIAIASGVPPEKAAAVGIITGIVGGLVVGFLAGCPLQVSGPAAGLAVIVGQLIQEHGFEKLGLIVMIAGAIQLLAGLIHVGQWFRAVSPAVIQGMLAGIGILIFAGQLHVMVDDKPPGTGKEFGAIMNLATLRQAVWKGLSEADHRPAAIIGVLTIAAIILWTALSPKKLKFIPAPLFGVFVGTAAAAIFRADANYITIPDNLTEAMQLPTFGDVNRLLAGPSLIEAIGPIFLAGLALAFVASAESLLTATAVDSMQQHASRTKYDRELMAQGTGNLLCGFVGALPITGVIVRSSANVLAGSRTRTSTILHGVWLLVFAVLLPQVLRLIPISSLAAVLVFTGYKLMNPAAVRKLLEFGKGEVAIYAATLGTVVVVDLLTGIVVGIGLAMGKLLFRFSHLDVRLEDDPERNRTVLHLEGAATFMALPKLASELEKVRPTTELHVFFENLYYIDHACLDLLANWEKQHQPTGGDLVIDWNELNTRFHRRNSNGKGSNSTQHDSAAQVTDWPHDPAQRS